MSSDEDEQYEIGLGQPRKKRKINRACDVCRRRKVKCDIFDMRVADGETLSCTNCSEAKVTCEFLESSKRRAPPRGYVESLEIRMKAMDLLLESLHPGEDFSVQVGRKFDKATFGAGTAVDLSRWNKDRQIPSMIELNGGIQAGRKGSSQPVQDPPKASTSIIKPPTPLSMLANAAVNGESPYGNQSTATDEADDVAFGDGMKERKAGERAFFGEGNTFKFVETVHPGRIDNSRIRRSTFWEAPSWEISGVPAPAAAPQLLLPPPDLLNDLIEIYFSRINPYRPLFIRRILEEELATRLGETRFICKLLLICAIASKFSDDPRVFFDPESGLSKGWLFYVRFKSAHESPFLSPGVESLQISVLLAIFLSGGPFSSSEWIVSSWGILQAMDMGYTFQNDRQQDVVRVEMNRRAFWNLLYIYREASAGVGKPSIFQSPQHYDIPLPSVLEEEKGTDMELAVQHLVLMVKLTDVIHLGSKLYIPDHPAKESDVESQLQVWLKNLPSKFHWNEGEPHERMFARKAMLQIGFFGTMVYIHRSTVIKSQGGPASLGAVAVCARYARSSIHVTSVMMKRIPHIIDPAAVNPFVLTLINATIVLADNAASQRSGLAMGESWREEVRVCAKFFKHWESTYLFAGKVLDILNDLTPVPIDELLSNAEPTSSSAPSFTTIAPAAPIDQGPFSLPNNDLVNLYLDPWSMYGFNNLSGQSGLPLDLLDSNASGSQSFNIGGLLNGQLPDDGLNDSWFHMFANPSSGYIGLGGDTFGGASGPGPQL